MLTGNDSKKQRLEKTRKGKIMYLRSFVAVLVFALILTPLAMAGPFDAVKKVVKEVGGVDAGSAPSSSAGASASAVAGSSGARPGVKKHDKNPPGVSYSTMLNGVAYQPDKGQLRLENIQATFIANDSKGYIILSKAGGAELYKWDWEVDTFRDMKPYYLLNIMGNTNLATGETSNAGWISVTEPGNYVLDFYLPDEHFYTFPFSVASMAGDDPFSSKDRWFNDGDWEKWAYFLYANADPGQSLVWKVWLRNKGTGRDVDVKPVIEVKNASGAIVCVSRDITITLQPKWNRFEFDMIFKPEGTSGGAYFKAKDLLEKDGAYTLTMSLGDEHYGTWKFSVEGGKFKSAGRTLRGQADPLTFVEGGNDAFWYCAE